MIKIDDENYIKSILEIQGSKLSSNNFDTSEVINNSNNFYELTKDLVDLIIKNTEKENLNNSNFKKRKLSVPDNLIFKSNFAALNTNANNNNNNYYNGDLTKSLNYTPIDKIFNTENARNNEIFRSMLEKSNSVHVSPYISKSIGSHIKNQNDRSKRTKEIFKELRNVNKINNTKSISINPLLNSSGKNTFNDLKEKIKNSGNFMKNNNNNNSNLISNNFLNLNNSDSKFFNKDNNNILNKNNVNTENENFGGLNFNLFKKNNSNNSINSNGTNNFNFDFKNLSSFCSSNTLNNNFPNNNIENNNNQTLISSFNSDLNESTPVFKQSDSKNLFFNATPERSVFNNNLLNSNSKKENNDNYDLAFNIKNNSNVEKNSENSIKNSNNNFNSKDIFLGKNLSFNFSEKDNNNNNNQNN